MSQASIRISVVVGLLCSGSVAFGKNSENQAEMKSLVTAGNNAYRSGHYLEAFRQFERAYEIKPNPKILLNQAEAARGLGNVDIALGLYARFLASGRSARRSKLRRKIEARMSDLRRRSGHLVVLTNSDQVLTVDGLPLQRPSARELRLNGQASFTT